ncbi:Leucine aminopeptidase 1 [Myotisia sp. PD_48]|nr:Leucine aminopeptidase 1 [Myotisia sp. PD_48]
MKATLLAALIAALAASSHAIPVEEQFLIETAPGKTQWVTESEKWALKRKDVSFFDITEEFKNGQSPAVNMLVTANYPTAQMLHEDVVKSLFANLSKENLQRDLTAFSQFHNRYYQSQYGVQSANWMLQQVQKVLTDSGAKGAKVEKFAHNFQQFSIIATIPGKSTKTVVVGAHQDSINSRNPSAGRAPGADDNGSGSVTILEALRAVLQNPEVVNGNAANTLEFHWYGGEEAGLLGSQAIFADYRNKRRDIKAMLNQDMTGFIKQGVREQFGLMTDFVDATLTGFCRTLISKYTKLPYINTQCGYACSDHASANRNGFPSAMVAETAFRDSNPNIHTDRDTLSLINYDHMLEHVKLVVGFMTELALADGL